MVTTPQLNFLLSKSLNMKRITTLILTSLALLTMTSTAMAEEVMDYNDLTPTFEFELKTGDRSKMALATRLQYKTSKGQIAYKDVDCLLLKGFFSKTIECTGLPLIEINANDVHISNGYGKFKVRVGDISNFNMPAGSQAIRLLARVEPPESKVYVKGLSIIGGQVVCEVSDADTAICQDVCDGYGIASLTAEYQTRYLYTTADGVFDVSVKECQVSCFCSYLPPEDVFFINQNKIPCQIPKP